MTILPKNAPKTEYEKTKTKGRKERITKVSWNGTTTFGIQLDNGQSVKAGTSSFAYN
jgi:hypothetical protein